MNWNDWLSLLRWRALEEGDAEGALLAEERRQEATARTRGGLVSDQLRGETAGEREFAFLRKRAEWLERETLGWGGAVARMMERLRVPEGRWSWAGAGWGLALAAGYALSALGQEAEFNLLALPLVGLLLWNAVMVLLSLGLELRRAPRPRAGLLEWLARAAAAGSEERAADGEVLTGSTSDQRFTALTLPAAMERLRGRLRAWLHVAAAAIALGSIGGLYAHGWSREYRAVWESTLLDEAAAGRFFSRVFGPAARALDLELPLERLPAMRRSQGRTAEPSPALPWIHLHAGTLLLAVVLPRLALAGFAAWRTQRRTRLALAQLGWRGYVIRTLRAIEGEQAVVPLLVHASTSSPGHREVWSRGVRERFGGMTRANVLHVPPGEEDDFLSAWKPDDGRAFLVFNLATTPEPEVHRQLAAEVRRRLIASGQPADLTVLLDATSIGNRWPPDKTTGREKLWNTLLEGLADTVLIAARRAA
jgi:hypothetical protein